MTREPTSATPALHGAMLRHGAHTDAPSPVSLRAGPLTLLFEEDSLRYIRLGDREIVRRIYCAVRDQNWGTLPNQVENLRLRSQDDSFAIDFDVRNVKREIDFRWHATITGDAQGTIVFAMNGEAHSDFRRNRIGFCVLHPIEGCAGKKCVTFGPDGERSQTEFPRFIAPENPFREIQGIEQELSDGTRIELRFAGDLFETEDQRNWTDASFKTFCTPLKLPFPVAVHLGDRVSQQVTLRIECAAKRPGDERSAHPHRSDVGAAPVLLTFANEPGGSLPDVGLNWVSRGIAHSAPQLERLRDLSLSHLRVELRLSESGFDSELSQAADDAAELRVPLEVAVLVSENADAELAALAGLAGKVRAEVIRWILFHEDHWTTPWTLIESARKRLAVWNPVARFGGGSRANFLELNRNRPPLLSADFVAWAIHPQEHAFDDASLIEAAAAQRDTLDSAWQFSVVPSVVGPITFKRRVNPYAKGPPDPPVPGALPPRVDLRQLSLFGAGWTLASLKYLEDAMAVSYFETIGWLGVMESETGCPIPEAFPSLPGQVFPLYFVFADVGEMKGARFIPIRSSAPLRVEALALRNADRQRILIANLSTHSQEVSLHAPAPSAGSARAQSWPIRQALPTRARIRLLDESNVLEATRGPRAFRAESVEREVSGPIELNLPPYSYACLDLV